MKLASELFVIPTEDDTFILYVPIKGVIMQVNRGTVGLLQRIKEKDPAIREEAVPRELFEHGIVVYRPDEDTNSERSRSDISKFEPTGVVLMPTWNCNLRCVYCYAVAGKEPADMDGEVAFAAIDFLITNAQKNGKKTIDLTFHGGGEPFLIRNWALIQSIVQRAQEKTEEKGLQLQLSASTNGILTGDQLRWIVTNFNHIQVSIDGPKDVQDGQRPPHSFDRVMETIAFLEQSRFSYNIRSTITEFSVSRMEEIVDFFHSCTALTRLYFEPLFECGRCLTTKYHSPSPHTFIHYFLKAAEKANQVGVELVYSGGRLGDATSTFCGALGSNFIITPLGDVTSCFEVTRRNDPRTKTFFYGAYDNALRAFRFDLNKLRILSSRRIENIPYCRDCFAKYNCAGDCASRVEIESGDMFDTSQNSRCPVNRELLLHQMKKCLGN